MNIKGFIFEVSLRSEVLYLAKAELIAELRIKPAISYVYVSAAI